MAELHTVVVGDTAIQVAATDAAKLDAYKAHQAKALADARAEHDKAIAAKDADYAKLEAERDDLKSKVLDDDAKAKLVADRVKLEADAKAIAPDVKPEGLNDADLRKAVVATARDVDGKSPAYIDAAFDIMLGDAGKADKGRDPVRKVRMGDSLTTTHDAVFKAAGVPMKKEA